MSTWFKQVANNGLSYLNAQIEPLRHRQKYGKTAQEISMEISVELETTLSRERDVERKIEKQEEDLKKIRSSHQELNFRVQNLDENRQFLFKQTSDYECKLSAASMKQKKLLITMDKLKTQLHDIEHMKLRSIALNLKGATELKQGTLRKIPTLSESRLSLQRRLDAVVTKHKQHSHVIEELSQKRDSLRSHLLTAQAEHEQLVKQHQEQQKAQQEQLEHAKPDNELIEVKQAPQAHHDHDDEPPPQQDEEMTTIFDNDNDAQSSLSSSRPTSPKVVRYDGKLWKQRIASSTALIANVHQETLQCEKQLEAQHIAMGTLLLEKLNLERELQRICDMLQLQSETLQSIENSRVEYSMQQEKYLKLRVNVQSKLDALQVSLDAVKDEMKKYRDDIQAIKEASNSLSQKKFDLASKLKKTIDKEHEIEEELKILHRNRMSLRSRKSQLIKQQISLQEESNESAMKYSTQSVNIIRCDCDEQVVSLRGKHKHKSNKHGNVVMKGRLTLSKEHLLFVCDDDIAQNDRYQIKHEIIDVSHSSLINYSSTTQLPMLLIYLNPQIAYQGAHKYISHQAQQLNVGNQAVDNCYKFKVQHVNDKNMLLLMHNFIETKRDLLERIGLNANGKAKANEAVAAQLENENEDEHEEKEKKKKKSNHNKKNSSNNFSIWDIEIEDEFYCHCTSGLELRQIISLCPSRTHIWRWKLFYSTAIHGISMNTLYGNCEDVEESILLIKDSSNHIFGAYLDVEWAVAADYRGSIDCFVFQFVDQANDESESEKKETETEKEAKSRHKLVAYRASGQHSYFLRSDMEQITIGAGECPALYFDSDLNLGRSTNCSTFRSPCLTKTTPFQITTLEIWGCAS